MCDQQSIAFQMGYEDGTSGRKYRNPVSGNPVGTQNFYFGFIKGKAERLGVPYDWTAPAPAWMED